VQEEKNLLKKAYLAIQVKRLMKYEINAFTQCDLVMAISRENEETIKACSPDTKTMIVPAGMDIDEVVENSNTRQLDLFFIGSFDWQPNLQGMEWFFENVWKQVKENFPWLQFVIAGNKMPESILKLHGENVVIAGRVPDAKQFILEHEVMLVPLVSGSGIRIKIVEAMALGKCIIATTIAAEGLGLTNGENILIANTADEFVQQIEKCSDAAFRNRIGFNAHSFALENFQNKRIFDKLLTNLRKTS
jgi:glycosyltransferase involved in cell wall biosynthesis